MSGAMSRRDRDAPPHADASSLSTPSNTSQRRSVAVLGSSLPLASTRRATPGQASAPGSSSIVRRTHSAQGPLGSYRSLSRSRTTPVREESLLGKRSFSSTHLQDSEFSTPQTSLAKRPLVSSALATAPRTTDGSTGSAEPWNTPLARHRSGKSDNLLTSSPTLDHAYELQMLRTEYDRRIQTEQRAYQTLETQLRSQSRELDALKCQRVEVLREWETERALQQERQKDWEKAKANLEEQLTSLRTETLNLRSLNEELRAQCQASASDARADVTSCQSQLVHLQAEYELARTENVTLSRKNEALNVRIEELESAASPHRRAESDADDVALYKDQLSQHITAVHRLEAANMRLKAENTRLLEVSARVDVLHETNKGLESKLNRMDALQAALLKKDNELTSIHEEQQRWISVLSKGVATDEQAAFVAAAQASDQVPQLDVPDTLTPETLPAYISTLRGTIMGLTARIEGLKLSAEQLRTTNVELSRRAAQDSETEISLRRELEHTSELLLRTQRRADIESDDLLRCKAVLASFEQEAQQGHASYESTHQLRISGLEERITSLQAECESLRQKLRDTNTIKTEVPAPDTVSKETQHMLETWETQYRELEKHAQSLESENETLWMRVGRGEYNVANERCLVLADNPVSRDLAIRTSALEALRKENQGLLNQVESLHKELAMAGTTAKLSELAPTDALVPLQTVENLRTELAQMQESLQLKDKGMLRLKQVFTAKANEFREAVQSLFGYKVRFMENGKVKLTSAYAGGARGTTLVFRSEEGNVGEMKLQGEANDGLANVSHLRDYWLSDGIRHSVPCFLAALNLELYENTTQAIRGSFGSADVEA